MNVKYAKPFVKWVGGKTQLMDDISSQIPYERDAKFTYIEPFLGGGSVLFWILRTYKNIQNIVVNDINTDLINAYQVVRNNVEELILVLSNWEIEYHLLSEDIEGKKDYYYKKRQNFNKRDSGSIVQAALFIFLNRTCFNGLYRVNKKNEFNVPIGRYEKPLICDSENLRLVSTALNKVTILNEDFEETLHYTTKNSLFYFDPPYKPISKTSSFNSYAKGGFNDDEQTRLAEFCKKLDVLGYRWILSNSDVRRENSDDDFFDNLYESFYIRRIEARRSINSNPNKRGILTELLITN